MERYEYIIELGKKLPLIKENSKPKTMWSKAANQSVVAGEQTDDKIVFTMIAILTKGILRF
jgi:cysteine desulfuration protein SufE